MGIFGNKKEKVEKKEEKTSSDVSTSSISQDLGDKDLSWVIKKPRITEKGAVTATESRAYIFDVNQRATKPLIKKAISEIYKVTPIKVNVTKIASKKIFSRGKRGTKSGGKKAYVFLKKGETIEFV